MSNRERAQQIACEHGNDAYSVAMAMLEGQNKIKVTQTDIGDSEWRSVRYVVSSVGGETDYAELSKAHILEREKLKRQQDASDVDINKIKAEAVSEVAEMSFIDDAFTYQMIKAHANKLENQND